MNNPIFRALVVEDNPSWQQILSEILSDSGLKVDVADNVEDAYAALKANPHRLAVVDLSLSPKDHNNYDGLRVLDAVKLLDPNCRTILLTGFATVELAVTALTDYGAYTFLRKESFHRGTFRDIIQRILVSAPSQSFSAPSSVSEASTQLARGKPVIKKSPSEKALVVEDDAGWRSILEEHLVDAGFNVHACASFGDALGFLRREKYTVAVIDMSLKDSTPFTNSQNSTKQNLEGHQLLATTRAEGIPTVVVSGMDEPEEIQKIYSEHAISAYIEKRTFDRNAFRRVIEDARAAHQSMSELSALTDREHEVLDLLAKGMTNKQIADQLVITTNTVKRHLKSIFEKLNVHTRSAATAKATGG